MPIANFTTSVDAVKTVMEIQRILVDHGARQILLNYDKEGQVSNLSFIIDTPFGAIPFRLPANASAVLNLMDLQGCQPRFLNYEHAVKVSWRILKDWIRAQMALLETEMVTVEQLFLPYMVINEEKTLYDKMIDTNFMLLQDGKG